MIVNALIVLIQIPILRKKFKWQRLLQIVVSIVFGYMIIVADMLIGNIVSTTYLEQWLLFIVGIVLVAIGVAFEMTASVLTLAGEGLVQSICMVSKAKFSTMKVICDVSYVVIAVAISYIFANRLLGVREGTIAAAVFVGLLSKPVIRLLKPLACKIFK